MWTQHSNMAEYFWSEQIRHSLLRHCLNWKLHSGRSFIKSILIEVFLGAFAGGGGSLIASIGILFSSVGCVSSGPSLFRSRDWVRHRSERLCMWGSGSNIAALKLHRINMIFILQIGMFFFCKANWIITLTWAHSSHPLMVNGNTIIGIPSSLRCLESLE